MDIQNLATEFCQTSYEYTPSSTLATTSVYCYRPQDVFISLGIEVVIAFAVIVGVIWGYFKLK